MDESKGEARNFRRVSGKILDLQFSDERNFLSVEILPNGSVQYSSAFSDQIIIDYKNRSVEDRTCLLEFNFENSSISFEDKDRRNQGCRITPTQQNSWVFSNNKNPPTRHLESGIGGKSPHRLREICEK